MGSCIKERHCLTRPLHLQHLGQLQAPSRKFKIGIPLEFLSNEQSVIRCRKISTACTTTIRSLLNNGHISSNFCSAYTPRHCFVYSFKNLYRLKMGRNTKYIRQYNINSPKQMKRSTFSSKNSTPRGRHENSVKNENNTNEDPFKGTFLRAILIGFAGGTYGALVGLGGSFVIIPLSLGYLGLNQHQAQATSLASVIGTGGIGAISYFLAGYEIDLEAAIAMALGAMLTANLGANLVRNISSSSLQLMYGFLQLAIGPMVLYKEEIKSLGKSRVINSTKEQNMKTQKEAQHSKGTRKIKSLDNTFQEYIFRNIQICFIGLASGFVAGIFGIGGGAVVVPALSIFTDMTHHSCIGTSLCSMVPAAAVGMITHYWNGTYTGVSKPSFSMIAQKASKKNIFPLLIPLAFGSGIGSYVGGKHIAPYVDESSLQILFAAMMTYLGFGGIRKSGVFQRILAGHSNK